MKILVAGKNGQVAQAMLACAEDGIEVLAFGRPELDITDKASVEQAVLAHKPDIIINAAAYTAVDKAEDDIANAFLINRDGAKNLAEVAHNNGLPIIHISTDYVFNGEKTSDYIEGDATGALGVYGLSKLEGEWAVADANPDHVILRTAWVYSGYGSNFVKTMLRLAETRDELNVVSDQWGTPTSADFIAKTVISIATQILSPQPPENWRGIFHMVPDGKTNWADFAREIFKISALHKGPTAIVHSIPASVYKTRAKRPQNAMICNEKLKNIYNIKSDHWQTYLSVLLNNT